MLESVIKLCLSIWSPGWFFSTFTFDFPHSHSFDSKTAPRNMEQHFSHRVQWGTILRILQICLLPLDIYF